MSTRFDPDRLCVPGDWGVRHCRSCNPQGLNTERPLRVRPLCEGCDGSGWTDWPAMATEPWSEIIPGLWIGGHDYVEPYETSPNGLECPEVTASNRDASHKVVSKGPLGLFDTVVSAYHRAGYEPDPPTEYLTVPFPDSRLDERAQALAIDAAALIATRVSEGKKVLSRCQAGLNRSSLMAGLAMVRLGFSGEDAVQLIRARRSPWALCNEEYAQFITGDVGAASYTREPVGI